MPEEVELIVVSSPLGMKVGYLILLLHSSVSAAQFFINHKN